MSLSSPQLDKIVEALMEANKDSINAVVACRLLTIFGLAILLYDHVVTFRQEVAYVWKAPNSFAKIAFLVNRYLVPVVLTVCYITMSGFVGIKFTNAGCERLHACLICLTLISIFLANALVLMRVMALWEGRRMAVILLTTGFAVSVTATLICFAKTLIVVLPTFIWEPFVNICAPQKTSRMLMAGWGCAMAYELLVLCATCWNAFDRPRTAQQPILRTLAQDGIYYFSSITICRVLTLALAATGKPHLAFIAIYFVWAMVTVALSHLILNLRRLDSDTGTTLPLELPSARRSSAVLPALGQVAAAGHSRMSWRDDRDGEPAGALRSRSSGKDGMALEEGLEAEDGDKTWEMGSYGSGVEVGKVEWVVEHR